MNPDARTNTSGDNACGHRPGEEDDHGGDDAVGGARRTGLMQKNLERGTDSALTPPARDPAVNER
jgi:hypothetical protein